MDNAGGGNTRGMQPGAGTDPFSVQSALRRVVSPLMRQIRRFETLCACVDVLPAELAGKAAPFDVRLGAPRSNAGAAAEGTRGEVNTLYIYVSTQVVGTIIEQRRAELMERINRSLAVTMVEDIRCEVAAPQRIERQLNILRAKPD